jgi:glycosyltransferase involved in cell wall biosynthesis
MIESDQILVTCFLFSYNQEKYIEDACAAVLAQTYSPLEIIFSDDCSSDRTFELIERMVKNYKGPHKIKLNRNNKNLGLVNHVNKSFEISSGELIVAAAGDDISLFNRIECLVEAYKKSDKKALVIHSSAIKINDNNLDLGILMPPIIERPMTLVELVNCHSLYIGATGAWNRVLYKEFGPIVFVKSYEDLVFGFRAAIKNLLVYVDEPLVRYRVGVGISAQPRIKILKFSSRIAIRKKNIKITIDVCKQRLEDINSIQGLIKADIVKARLIRNIKLENKRLLFYRNPLALLCEIFSIDSMLVLRAFRSEVKYITGLK